MDIAPTTAKQLAVYNALNQHEVKWKLVGGLAYIFNGRRRPTMDIDILLENSKENMRKLTTAMLSIGYNMSNSNDLSLQEHTRLRVVNDAIVDLHSEFCQTRYDEVQCYVEEFQDVQIHVVTREGCVTMLQRESKHPGDLEVLLLSDDPHNNWEEITKWQ